MQPLLQTINLSKTFFNPSPIHILQNINLTVHEGESVAILGRSGEGKSTLLQILGTLDAPTSGSLLINNTPVIPRNAPKIRNQLIGFVFQAFHLLEDETALNNILMPAKIGRKPTHQASISYKYAWALLEQIQLTHRAHTPAKWLSGGEKQRVSIARAMINQPKLLLTDEPSGNLDKETAKSIHQLLLNLTQTNHTSLIIVTHDPFLAKNCHTQYLLQNTSLLRHTGDTEIR